MTILVIVFYSLKTLITAVILRIVYHAKCASIKFLQFYSELEIMHTYVHNMTEAEVRKYCWLLFDQAPEKDKQINMIRYTLNEITEETFFHIENKYARIGGNPKSVQLLQDISELKDQLKEVHEKIELLKRMNRIFSNYLEVLSKDHLREASQKSNAIDEF
jgi:hypothetical protein